MAISSLRANEVYKKISPLIESQFPEHIRENGPNFVAFLEAYYEYLEQTNKAGNAIRTLNDNQDIDRTVSDFVEYFRREFALSIPKSALADKRLIVKHIREFYRSRGSQKSFKFLFHILFGKEVDFYYPGEDILRASDGRWIVETVITVEKNTGNFNLLDGRVITGQTSGATGRVQNIKRIISGGIEAIALTVEKVTGTYVDTEIISDGFGNTVKVKGTIGDLTAQTITHGGVFNVKGDTVTLTGESTGAAATGTVTSIDTSTGLTFTITRGGSGYRTGVNSLFAIGVGGGTNLKIPTLSVVSLSNTSTLTIFTDLIKSVQSVKLDGGITSGNASLTFAHVGANSTTLSANLASANIYSVIGAKLKQGTVSVGTINAISIASPGNAYTSAPSVTVTDLDVVSQALSGQNGNFQGQDAVITASIAPGRITGITVSSTGKKFSLGEKVLITNNRTATSNTTTLDSSTSGIRRHVLNVANNGNTFITGISATRTLDGRYLGTKGFLSWNNRIQDNDYYQEFSYVLKSTKLVDTYRDVVKDILHVAGTKMFGFHEIISAPNVAITTASSVPEIIFESNFLALTLEDNSGYVRIEDPGIRFIQENVDYDGFISDEGADATDAQDVIRTGAGKTGYIIGEEHDINFVSYVELETPGAYIRDSRKEIITSTVDRSTARVDFRVDIRESGVTPSDRTAVNVSKNVTVSESVTPVDAVSALIFQLSTTTGQSTGFVRVVYGNTQITTFSTDTVNLFKAVQVKTMGDLDGIPRLVLVTPPNVGINMDRQANGNFGNGSIVSSTSVKIIPVGGSNATVFTVSTVHSNNFLTLTTDYLPTTANAQLYWGV